ncbi:MAG: hypothetical protein ACOCSC_02365 [Candidatus Hadarchaeota archaeon]
MANITLSIPNDVYRKMKKYKEIKWSEVARKAIMEYLEQLEESDQRTTKELLDELGEDFRSNLEKLSLEDAVEGYEKMRDAEWKRTSTITTS